MTSSPTERDLSHRLEAVQARIAGACQRAGRDPAEITLLAVSKRHHDATVRALASLGHRDFGENLVQAWRARLENRELAPLRWHLVGPLQTNKAKLVAAGRPDLVHSVDRPAIVEALAHRWDHGRPLDVLIQVNIDHAPGKAGCHPDHLDALADQIAAADALRLRGLMAIPRPGVEAPPRPAFAHLRERLNQVSDRVEGEGVLSMGMSADLEDAVAEGSTLVRVGTALFGARP